MRFVLVCLAGAFGTGARYLLGGWAQRVWGLTFPYGTVVINLLGSFLLVVVMSLGGRGVIGPDTRVILATGVMGGFTTYSAFNYETLRLLANGSPGLAALNLLTTVVGCLLAGGLGFGLMRLLG